ncbi:hypothetical protein RIR_jg35059.t1 [Rhizophagus irregularis DAOM 181602=DAOM 197198]|nr:hypothetical protein RIR_jg35059.t1 [Rhizophagus irregularis DAOM 181602=DAOM 197198]
MMNDNIDYDTFVRNLPNPVNFSDIFNDPLSDTLFSSSSSTFPITNSFNISSFNVNSLKTPGQGSFKMDQISSFFLQNHISFGATHVQFYQSHSSRILSVDLFFKGNVKLRTYHHLDTITRIDFIWSCPLLRQYMLTTSIFDAHDLHISDHNPIITYFDASLLSDAIKSARARQLGRNTRQM